MKPENGLFNVIVLTQYSTFQTSFVRQFAHGMLSREAVRKLIETVDTALDKEDG